MHDLLVSVSQCMSTVRLLCCSTRNIILRICLCAFPVLPSQVWRRFSESTFSGCYFGKHTCRRRHNRCVWRKRIQSSAIGTCGHQLYGYSCCVIIVLRTMPWCQLIFTCVPLNKISGYVWSFWNRNQFHVGMRLFCLFFYRLCRCYISWCIDEGPSRLLFETRYAPAYDVYWWLYSLCYNIHDCARTELTSEVRIMHAVLAR